MSNIDINKRLKWDEIDEKISEDYNYLNKMLELVPPQDYFPLEVDEEKLNNRWKRRKKTPEEIENEKALKLMKQQDKFDPENYKSVPQILKEKGEEIEQSESENNGSIDTLPSAGFSLEGTSDQEDFRKKKLMEKINDFRNKRKATDQNDEERQTKRQRTNKKNNKKPTQKNNKNGKEHKNGIINHENGHENGVVHENGKNGEDMDEDIEYGTFDFSSGVPVPTYLSHKKKGTDKKILLRQAEEKQRLLEELKDTEEGKELKKDLAWDSMIKRAKGEKVKDDPKKLKNSIKRSNSKKLKSKEQWDSRIKQQKKKQAEAIKKRNSNIQKKIQRKKGF